ncbi:MAG: Lrp/AsnC family transcriptional regulator [Kibdelosporangium sp.]
MVVKLDDLDRRLIHALAIDGRASFSRIAEVIGVSDQTIARRYRRLRATGAARVVGHSYAYRVGDVRWYMRLRCTPDAVLPIANALAKRPDTFWVHVVSGGTEINCVTQARSSDDSDELLLQKLPRTPQILDVTAHNLLHTFFGGEVEHPGLIDSLTHPQAEALRPPRCTPRTVTLDDADHRMIDALGEDGRAGYATLAAASGWSESTVKRRLDYLRHAGVVYYDVDVDTKSLGFLSEARLWMSVLPSQLVAVGEALAKHPEVAFAAAVTGPTNLVASVVCKDIRALYSYLTERIGALTAIRQIETAPIIRTVKRGRTIVNP